MQDLIAGALRRQARGLELLEKLQLEEFDLLLGLKVEEIGGLEFSIHELLRQMAAERACLARLLAGPRLQEYAASLDKEGRAEQAAELRGLYAEVDKLEQRCARQGERNCSLSLALLDQSHDLMNALHGYIQPPQEPLYQAGGALRRRRPEAVIFSGRL